MNKKARSYGVLVYVDPFRLQLALCVCMHKRVCYIKISNTGGCKMCLVVSVSFTFTAFDAFIQGHIQKCFKVINICSITYRSGSKTTIVI